MQLVIKEAYNPESKEYEPKVFDKRDLYNPEPKTEKEGVTMQTKQLLRLYSQKMSQFQKLRLQDTKGISQKQIIMQDILNESMIKLLALSEKETIKNVEHLFNKTLRNTTIDKMRSFETSENIIEFFDSYNDIEKSTDFTQYNNYKGLLKHVLKKLKKKVNKKLFVLYHVKGMSQKEIALKLYPNLTENNARVKTNRTIKALNQKLYRMKLKNLYRTEFATPCTTQDKKLPKYKDHTPSNAVKIKREYGPFKGQVAYLYKSDLLDKETFDKETFDNNLKLANNRGYLATKTSQGYTSDNHITYDFTKYAGIAVKNNFYINHSFTSTPFGVKAIPLVNSISTYKKWVTDNLYEKSMIFKKQDVTVKGYDRIGCLYSNNQASIDKFYNQVTPKRIVIKTINKGYLLYSHKISKDITLTHNKTKEHYTVTIPNSQRVVESTNFKLRYAE